MTIGEMAKKTNLPASTLRYYEANQLIRVTRDKNGRRVYEEDEVQWIQFICRLKETGMKLKDIQQYAKYRYQGKDTMLERLKILLAHRDYVLEQKEKWDQYLKNLEQKIQVYKNSLSGSEKIS